MDSERFADIACAVFGEAQNDQGFVRVNCPRCAQSGPIRPDQRKSLSHRPETGWFECWRCRVQGRLQSSGARVFRAYRPPETEKRSVPKISLPSGLVDIWHPSAEEARRYLTTRGIGRRVWDQADLFMGTQGRLARRVVVPVMTEVGDWVGFSARDISGRSGRKYIYPLGFPRGLVLYNGSEIFRDTQDPIVLVEGVFDALPHFGFCVASLGKPTQDQLRLLAQTKRQVLVCLDGDAWKDTRSCVLKLKLLGVRARPIKLIPGQDPGGMTHAEFLARVQEGLRDES